MSSRSDIDELGSGYMVPIPDAIREGDKTFVFEPGPPHIDLKERTMSAPVDLSERTRVTQLRELGIAKWSPEKRTVGGIAQSVLGPVEQARIDSRLKTSGFDISGTRFYHDDTIDYTVKHCPVDLAAGMLIQSRHTADREAVEKRFRKRYHGLADHIVSAMGVLGFDYYESGHDQYRTWDYGVERAKAIQALLKDYMEENQKMGDMPDPKTGPEEPTNEEIVSAMLRIQGGGECDRWADMVVTEPPRPLKLPLEMLARKTIKSDTGAVPIALHRATIDGRVFSGKRRKPGAGAVLIDQSGSMSLDPEDIENVLKYLPGAIIATYCSSDDQGELRVLAKNGRRVDHQDLIIGMGGNGIDGPALAWIGGHRGPRFWVSDGHVTGRGDSSAGPSLIREVKNTIKQFRILRVDDCYDLTLHLARKAHR
ncbi:MAG TPA: hypothetical protein VNN79_05980 [Actinomycetota bacterium]|nr:hypothetical protein [Actinomycetota bacterium]